MAEFRVIDADSHVEEPVEAWSYLDPKYEARRPFSDHRRKSPVPAQYELFLVHRWICLPKGSRTGGNDLCDPGHHGTREAQAFHPG